MDSSKIIESRPATRDSAVARVADFSDQVAGKLNRILLIAVAAIALLLASGFLLAIAVGYVVQGYQVPLNWYLATAIVATVAAILAWFTRRVSRDRAAEFADSHFQLKNSLQSCLHFSEQGKDGQFYDLQARQASKQLDQTSLEKIPTPFPWRIGLVGMLMLVIAISLGFKGPSQTVLEREQRELATKQATAAANEQLKNLVDELEESIDNEEDRELLKPDELRKWVEELKQTTDQKEAMRQYARLELKLNRAAEALQQRQEEKLLDKAAEELKKDDQAKQLGQKLEQKKYRDAAKDLDKMKIGKLDPKDRKLLSERKKELARLKAAAQRMAQAARATKGNQRNQSGKSSGDQQPQAGNPQQANQAGKSGKPGEAGQIAGDAAQPGQELAGILEELDEAVEELDQELEDLELSEQNEDDLQQCEECENGVAAKLDELGDKLIKLARKRDARKKLKALSKACAQCQSSANAKAQQIASGAGKGGKEAGTGTSDSVRDQKDPLQNNNQYSQLKGIKGDGPSLTKIESAEDGTGVSNKQSQAQQREFQKQFESFVNREDIPDDLKNGVREYFLKIHEPEQPAGEQQE